MPWRTPANWHALHGDLERLLAEGQAAPIRLLLQARFLRESLAGGEAVWAAYGFPVALSFLQRLDGDLARCGEGFLRELEETLQACFGRSVPPWARGSEWEAGLEAARLALGRERQALGGIVGDDYPADSSAAPVGTPGDDATPAPLGSGSVLVPVILGVQSGRGVPVFFQEVRASCLIRLTVEAQLLYRRARSAELTLEGPTDPQTRAGLEEAAAFLGHVAPPGTPAIGHYWFHVRWDLSGARLSGRSATLGFLLAARSAHDSFSLSLGHRRLSDSVAVTGDLRDGVIAPVDSIPEKIKACFYSTVRTVVVPAEQRDEAVREVRVLEQSHPGKQLLVLGAGKVNDLWNESTITIVRTRSLQQFLRATLRRVAVSRALVAVLVGLFLLLAGLSGRELWLQRPWPVEARWDGEDLVYQNASGRAYHREHLPPGTPRAEIEAFHYRAARVAAAMDLDGHSPDEVAVIRWNPGFEGNNLQVRSGRGRTLWSLPSQVGLANSPLKSESLNWRFFGDAGTDRSGSHRLLAVRRSLYGSLCLVDLVQGKNGHRVGLLVNQGHLGRLLAEDVDLDGRRDLLVAGTDNTEDVGLLVLIDPGGMQMPPPSWTTADLVWMTRPEALGRGVRAAVRLPKDRLLPAGRPDCIEGLMKNGLLLVTTGTEVPGRYIIYSLDLRDVSHPVAARVVLTDSYRDMLATRASSLSPAEISREQERLLHEISYLTTEGWQPVPVRAGPGENRSAEEAGRD